MNAKRIWTCIPHGYHSSAGPCPDCPVPTVPGWDAAHDDRLYNACGGCGAHAGLPCEPGCTDSSGRAKHSVMPEVPR